MLPRRVGIRRFEKDETVVVVAESDGVAMYYEDVEDGWNLSRLGSDGYVLEPGYEQDDISVAIYKWQGRSAHEDAQERT